MLEGLRLGLKREKELIVEGLEFSNALLGLTHNLFDHRFRCDLHHQRPVPLRQLHQGLYLVLGGGKGPFVVGLRLLTQIPKVVHDEGKAVAGIRFGGEGSDRVHD